MSFPAFGSSVSEPRGKNSKKAVVTCVRGLTGQSEQDWLSLLLLLLFSLQGIPEGKGIKKWKVIEKVSEIGQMGSVP